MNVSAAQFDVEQGQAADAQEERACGGVGARSAIGLAGCTRSTVGAVLESEQTGDGGLGCMAYDTGVHVVPGRCVRRFAVGAVVFTDEAPFCAAVVVGAGVLADEDCVYPDRAHRGHVGSLRCRGGLFERQCHGVALGGVGERKCDASKRVRAVPSASPPAFGAGEAGGKRGDSRGRAFGILLRIRICRTDTGDPCYADYDLPRSAYMRCAW